MSALNALTFLEIYNASFGSWAPVLRVIYFIYFDRPETVRDRAKMNWAGHRVRRPEKLFRALRYTVGLKKYIHHSEQKATVMKPGNFFVICLC